MFSPSKFPFCNAFSFPFPFLFSFFFFLFFYPPQKKRKEGLRGKKEVLNQKKAKHGYAIYFLFSFEENEQSKITERHCEKSHFQQSRGTLSSHVWKGEERMNFHWPGFS